MLPVARAEALSGGREISVGHVGSLTRYPVKSMLGEACQAVDVGVRGVSGDRIWALLDALTGKIASAKRPNPWRGLLACSARTADGGGEVEIRLPDGTALLAGDPQLDRRLSALLGRGVRLLAEPPDGAELDRAHPEAVLADGIDAEVGSDILKIGAGAPAGTFFDFAAVHLVTTATLDGISAALADGPVEPARYRANIVVRSPPDARGFPENAWVGGTIRIGGAAALRVVLPTPRCAVPALAHGSSPPRPGALRAAIERNRVDIPGFGVQPCAGVYAEVVRGGAIRAGDRVTFTPAETGRT